tara:strand:+ start:230 stop:799 length:570 start_codon:yes stop_codon:yes gene_type:complete
MSGLGTQAGMHQPSNGGGPGSRFGFNFRQSLAYVDDEEGETFVSPTKLYDGGAGYGWVTSPATGRNRNAGLERRLCGMNYASGSIRTFRYDLPNGPGLYRIWAGFFDWGYSQRADWALRDGTDNFTTTTGPTGSSTVVDATGASVSIYDWSAMNAGNPYDHHFVSDYFTLMNISTFGVQVVSHLAFQKL